MPFLTPVLLPKRDNLGRPFDQECYRAFPARMIQRFRGWTRKGQDHELTMPESTKGSHVRA